MEIVRSVYDHPGELLRALVGLHCNGSVDADVTYGAGAIWKDLEPPQLKFDISPRPDKFEPSFKFDILPRGSGVIAADVRHLPLRNKSLKSVMFDPPFIAGAEGVESESLIQKNQYGSYKNSREMMTFFRAACREISRVLKTYGILIFKCQDFVNGRAQFWAHMEIHLMAIELGFKLKDLLILNNKNRPIQSNLQNQCHARKFHTWFMVFKKVRVA